jgi:hypothetical protein
MRLGRPLLLIGLLVVAGCGGGAQIKHATQPNGPPQPPPPPPERLDTASKRTKAIQTVVEFAKPKYKATLLYEAATAQFLEPKKIAGAHGEDGKVTAARDSGVTLGTWRVDIPVSNGNRTVDASAVEGIKSMDQMPTGGLLAREFMLGPTGQVTENPPIGAPPPVIHGTAPTPDGK